VPQEKKLAKNHDPELGQALAEIMNLRKGAGTPSPARGGKRII
jgi:hypothetical protein